MVAKDGGEARAESREPAAFHAPSPGREPRSRVLRWLSSAIASGELRPGDAVPSVDVVSRILGVAKNTAAAAIVDAERLHVVERRAPGARKRYVPESAGQSPLLSATVFVLGDIGRFSESRGAPRWSDAFIALDLSARLSRIGKHVMFLNGSALGESSLDSVFRTPPAGMVVTSSGNDSPVALHALALCRDIGIPAVVYGNAPELRCFDRVHVDHRDGARKLTEWLVAHGRRNILPFFPFEPEKHWARERLEGYEEAMRAAGLEPRPCAVFGDTALESHAKGERRFRFFKALAVTKLMEIRRECAVDAILCINDEWSLPAIAAIRELGLEPNRDILVAGYDNVTSDAALGEFEALRPAVTIDKHNEISSADLSELLVARMTGKLPPGPQERTHGQELVARVEPVE